MSVVITDPAFEPHQRRLDTLLNKTFLDLATFSAVGYGVGLAASIFFRRSYPIRNFVAGIGGSYGIVQNRECFHKLL